MPKIKKAAAGKRNYSFHTVYHRETAEIPKITCLADEHFLS